MLQSNQCGISALQLIAGHGILRVRQDHVCKWVRVCPDLASFLPMKQPRISGPRDIAFPAPGLCPQTLRRRTLPARLAARRQPLMSCIEASARLDACASPRDATARMSMSTWRALPCRNGRCAGCPSRSRTEHETPSLELVARSSISGFHPNRAHEPVRGRPDAASTHFTAGCHRVVRHHGNLRAPGKGMIPYPLTSPVGDLRIRGSMRA